MLALSRHSSLRVFAMNLVLCQVRETDTDGGQGLCVIGLHDVAQQSHPELLGQGCEGGSELEIVYGSPVIDKTPPRLKPCRLPPGICGRFGPYLASIPNSHKLSTQLTFLPTLAFFRGIQMASAQFWWPHIHSISSPSFGQGLPRGPRFSELLTSQIIQRCLPAVIFRFICQLG